MVLVGGGAVSPAGRPQDCCGGGCVEGGAASVGGCVEVVGGAPH